MKLNFTKRHILKYIKTVLGVIAILVNTGCESFVEVDIPDDQLYGDSVFQDESTATAALLAIYADYRDNTLFTGGNQGISYLLGHYADELTLYSNLDPLVDAFNTNSIIPSNTYINTIWNNSFNLVYQANVIIEKIDHSSGLTEEVGNQIMGEALFNRALIHFYLMNLFGEIPYVLTTNYEENSNLSRLSEQAVLEQVIKDLQQAKSLIAADYVSAYRTRPNKWACSALLARVYLNSGNWEMAQAEADEVISQTDLYALPENLNEVFLKDSPETIWQFDPGLPGLNTEEAINFIFVQAPPPDSSLSTILLEAFEDGDKRTETWIGRVSDGTTTYAYPYKYKEVTNTGTSVEFSVQSRLAEVYLIRAEARAQMGNLTGGMADLNRVRTRAGLAGLANLSEAQLVNAILNERQVELFTELGHRFFDLKRLDRIDQVLGMEKPFWEETDRLLPIPQNEIEINPNLRPQNPGY